MADLFSLFDERFKSPRDVSAVSSQNLESLSKDEADQEFFLQQISLFEEAEPKVDYSDFSNFVFFNSALDYFNITGEKILNEYPYDRDKGTIQQYLSDLDGYQRYVVSVWPARVGHLRFNPAVSSSYVRIEDTGVYHDVQSTGLLNVGTGSLTVETWSIPPPALTGSNDVMVIIQKTGSAGDGYTSYFSGSRVYFRFTSASLSDEVSSPCTPGQISYFAFIVDRSPASGTLSIMTGSTTEFPVVVSSASVTVTGTMYMGHGYAFIGSGSLSGKVVRPLTGALDDVRVWNVPRTVTDVSSSFNCKIFSQDNLVALWRFNESGSVPNDQSSNAIVQDHSGRKINGRIQNYFDAIRGSGSLLNFDEPDLILKYETSDVKNFVNAQQTSGSAYDKTNDNIVTRLLPAKYFDLETEETKETDVLQNFMYVLARQFDFMKLRIEQFTNVLRSNYGEYDQTPDALLADVARFFGWEFTGNFLSADAFQYMLGKNVLRNVDTNKKLEQKLFEIKNEFWKRTLNNLIYLYKTKGTRESIEALLRTYGVNDNFVKVKEFGFKPVGGVMTSRIRAEKGVYALGLGSGSITGSVSSSYFSASLRGLEVRLRFPLTSSTDITASHLTGSVWYVLSGSVSGAINVNSLTYLKTSAGSPSGALILSGTNFYLSMSAPIFDNSWYNVAAVMDEVSSSVNLSVRSVRDGAVYNVFTSSYSATPTTSQQNYQFCLGASASLGTQYWAQEFRVWERKLNDVDLVDHALNFQSYGVYDPTTENSKLALHWRLNENYSGSNTTVNDVSTYGRNGIRSRFHLTNNPYKKFLNEYSYIATPEYGWNEDKIRVIDASTVKPADAFSDNKTVALEFNMVDALNEDISQIFSSMDVIDNMVGLPANRYRSTYEALDAARRQYFKRLQGRLYFKVFADMLEFFDRSFIHMVRRLVPASVRFVGDEFVVESHMLERPKVQWNYRRQERAIDLSGSIQVFIR